MGPDKIAMDNANQPSQELEEIKHLLSRTDEFMGRATLPLMVAAVLDALERARADLDYFRKNEKLGKRPFSDALSGNVINSQVQRIIEMEHTILDLREQLTEQDNIRGAMFFSTIEAHKQRIAELEGPANAFREIERYLDRRPALDGYTTAGEKIAAMLHMCAEADPSGKLIKQQEN